MNPAYKGAILLGMGTIGMLDGIVFHQILQWHSTIMHTDRFHQIMSDGVFHLLATIIIFWGAYLLWKSRPEVRNGSSLFWGGVLVGAGLFNFVEGIVNHHWLQLHHVKPGPQQFFYDVAYDLSGILLLAIGWFVKRRSIFPHQSVE